MVNQHKHGFFRYVKTDVSNGAVGINRSKTETNLNTVKMDLVYL